MAISPRASQETLDRLRFCAAKEDECFLVPIEGQVFVQGHGGYNYLPEIIVTSQSESTKYDSYRRVADLFNITVKKLKEAIKAHAIVNGCTIRRKVSWDKVELVQVGTHFFRTKKEAAMFLSVPIHRLNKRMKTNTPFAGCVVKMVCAERKWVNEAAYKAKPPHLIVVSDSEEEEGQKQKEPLKKRKAPGPTKLEPYVSPQMHCWNIYRAKAAETLAMEEAANEKAELRIVAETLCSLGNSNLFC